MLGFGLAVNFHNWVVRSVSTTVCKAPRNLVARFAQRSLGSNAFYIEWFADVMRRRDCDKDACKKPQTLVVCELSGLISAIIYDGSQTL